MSASPYTPCVCGYPYARKLNPCLVLNAENELREIITVVCPLCRERTETAKNKEKHVPPPRSKKSVRRECTSCGKSFKPQIPSQKYCSRSCYALAQRRPARPCVACGTEFQPSKEDRQYCSQACYFHTVKANAQILKICPRCGLEFATNDKRAKYCSRPCYLNR